MKVGKAWVFVFPFNYRSDLIPDAKILDFTVDMFWFYKTQID